MENASKALLIAAAIIIAIILISLGVYVVRQGQSAMGSINLSEQEIAAFNSKWEAYEGPQMGSSIKSLQNQVSNYNRTTTDRKISINRSGATDFSDTVTDAQSVSGLSTGSRYNVTFDYNSAGLICNINVEQ